METCPYCENEFEIVKYGWKIPCPHCNKLLNIIPEPQLFIYIDGKAIGISIVEGNEETLFALIVKSFSKLLPLIKFS